MVNLFTGQSVLIVYWLFSFLLRYPWCRPCEWRHQHWLVTDNNKLLFIKCRVSSVWLHMWSWQHRVRITKILAVPGYCIKKKGNQSVGFLLACVTYTPYVLDHRSGTFLAANTAGNCMSRSMVMGQKLSGGMKQIAREPSNKITQRERKLW